ncbi:MAG: OB-fold nucleic acid binding domain-containing protein [Candidatus Bathyarchaeota archaeon]|nr:OB-fold nucleic acid binding domain-containing protein [Candidatus Bathyarchaeota archaeon]
MTTQDLIAELLSKNPQLSQEQILAQLQAERAKTGGLLGDETLLRLIAARCGVAVAQTQFQNKDTLCTSRLFKGLYDVTVTGRVVAVFGVKTFQGEEKSGKFATLMLADEEGLLRVVLWNEQAELVERGELKAGQSVRFVHGYTRDDRYGKTELHMGNKSLIEIEPDAKAPDISFEKFTTKIKTLNPNLGNVHVFGTIKAVFEKRSFTKNDNTDGAVLRLVVMDDSGEAIVVAWNEKTVEVEHAKPGMRLLLVNARVKDASNGAVEVHVDSNTFVSLGSEKTL